MRSTRSSHIWLIQPPDPVPAITPIDAAGGDSVHFSPAWDLLCLQEFILKRTGHTCELIDTRLSEPPVSALERMKTDTHFSSNRVALIYGTLHNLDQVAMITLTVKQHHPDVSVVLCGPFPTAFPASVDKLPGVDYALCGDAEPILRNLLDFCDIEHRLKLVSGLIIPGAAVKEPSWVADLKHLNLPEWKRIRWSSYHTDIHANGVRVEARLSRGHTDRPEDLFYPVQTEPLRMWPLASLASLIQACPGHGISEVYFADPPGLWTEERILEWCDRLDEVRSTQPWAFRMMPRDLSDTELDRLSFNGCRRIELIVPACSPGKRIELGYTMPDSGLNRVVVRMAEHRIRAQIIYWIQGPYPVPNEADIILSHMKSTLATEFAVYPYPFHHDSALYPKMREEGHALAPATDWISWAQTPDDRPHPPALWTGDAGLAAGRQTLQTIQRKVVHNPWFRFLRFVKKSRSAGLASCFKAKSLFAVSNPRIVPSK